MDDIKIPPEDHNEDDQFFIRSVEGDGMEGGVDFEKTAVPGVEDMPPMPSTPVSSQTATKQVSINFANFVRLVANHSYVDIVDQNADQEIIVSSNLLTDLANAHDRSREKRMPMIFVAGLVIGIILTYIILK